MNLEERFRYLMKLNDLTASAFADEIGVQRSSISHILSGRNKPSLELIQKVLNRFPKVDAIWLINGTTKVEKESSSIVQETSSREDNVTGQLKSSGPKGSLSSAEETIGKKIKRIVVFYDDQSFEEFTPNT